MLIIIIIISELKAISLDSPVPVLPSSGLHLLPLLLGSGLGGVPGTLEEVHNKLAEETLI